MASLVRSILAAIVLGAAIPAGAAASVELAGNARGDQVILHRVLDQHTRPLYVGSRSAGGAFGPLVPISPTGGWWAAQGFVDGSGAAVTTLTSFRYLELEPPISQVAVRPAGGAFEGPVDFYPGQAGALRLDANESGDAIVTDGSSYRFRPRGGGFGPLADLPGADIGYRGAAVDADGTATAYGQQQDGRWFQAVRPPGGEFGPPEEIPALGTRLGRLVTARNGRAMLVGIEGSSVWVADRPPGGQFVGTSEIASTEPGAVVRDVALAPSRAAAVAYGASRTSVVVRDAGGFHEPRNISTTTLRVAVDDFADAAAVWTRRDHTVAATYRVRGAPFSRTFELAAARPFAPGPVDPPGLAIDDAGRATAAWEESNGARVQTLVRDMANNAPVGRARVVDSIPSYAREGPPSACAPPHSTMLQRSAEAAVFVSEVPIYGCLLKRGTPVDLPPEGDEEGAQRGAFALAGPLVAYGTSYTAHSTAFSRIVVTDLRDPYSGLNRGALVEFDGFDVTASFLAIRLKRNGAVAFIESREDVPRTKHVQIWNAHATKPREIDAGDNIDPRTFNLRGSLLTWRHGKRLRRAVLR